MKTTIQTEVNVRGVKLATMHLHTVPLCGHGVEINDVLYNVQSSRFVLTPLYDGVMWGYKQTAVINLVPA